MQGGTDGRFRAFYERAMPVVYGYLHQRLGGDAARAMDVTQEAFMTILQQWPVPLEVDNDVGWAIGIARHKLLDELRRERRHIARLQRAAVVPPGNDAVDTPAWEARLHHALADVPSEQRAALFLRYADDLPVAEVARLLGRSIHATESLLARGRRNLERAYDRIADV